MLCLGGKITPPEHAKKIVDAFLNAISKAAATNAASTKWKPMHAAIDLQLHTSIPKSPTPSTSRRQRQQENIELIASENFTSPAVMEAQGSVLTNKYAEGYPKKRWYGGCENVDMVEQLAIDRAKKLFGAEHANVQPHSGSGANMAVYFAFLKPGDKMLTMDLSHGGHLTHGNKANFSGKFFEIVHYGVRKEDERIDYDQLAKMAREHQPKMITVGASAYPRIIDFARMGEIAREVGAICWRTSRTSPAWSPPGCIPAPSAHADFVTTTTHKTLRGPRGGLILCREKYAKEIDSQAFPASRAGRSCTSSRPRPFVSRKRCSPLSRHISSRSSSNARALAEGMKRNGFRLVSGGTDNHLMLVDVGAQGLDRQGLPDRAGRSGHHGEQEHDSVRNPFALPGQRHSPRHAGRHHSRHERSRKWPPSPT